MRRVGAMPLFPPGGKSGSRYENPSGNGTFRAERLLSFAFPLLLSPGVVASVVPFYFSLFFFFFFQPRTRRVRIGRRWSTQSSFTLKCLSRRVLRRWVNEFPEFSESYTPVVSYFATLVHSRCPRVSCIVPFHYGVLTHLEILFSEEILQLVEVIPCKRSGQLLAEQISVLLWTFFTFHGVLQFFSNRGLFRGSLLSLVIVRVHFKKMRKHSNRTSTLKTYLVKI